MFARNPPITDPPIRLGVLVSGGGTTLQNFIDRIGAGRLRATVAVVISSKREAGGIERAEAAGLPVEVVERSAFRGVEEFSQRIFECCRRHAVDLVTMAGFLSLVKIPPDFSGRVMNIHPALIPAFCGKGLYGHRVHEAVLESGVRLSGCTVHFADDQYDHGPIIVQRAVPILDDDTPETLAARVFEQECEAYPQAIELYAAGRLKVEGRRVRIL